MASFDWNCHKQIKNWLLYVTCICYWNPEGRTLFTWLNFQCVFPVLFYITQPSKWFYFELWPKLPTTWWSVPYHGQFQKSYQRRIEYGGTGKTTTKQNTINNSWMSLGRPVFGSGLLFCSASLENSQIPRWFVIYESLIFLYMPLH